MDDLIAWLLEQVDKDEHAATAAFSGQVDRENGWGIDGRAITPHVGVIHEAVQRVHVARWNPARVLVECEAKRRIISDVIPEVNGMDDRIEGEWGHGLTGPHEEGKLLLSLLALPYADRPGYREEWKP